MSHYVHYYDVQAGGGIKGVRNVFVGSSFQRGSGIGSFLGSILRQITPYLLSGAKAVGKEAVRTGLNVVKDVASSGVNFKEAFETRAKESGRNLKRKAATKLSEMMQGSGYKSRTTKRRRQSKRGRSSASSSRKKRSSSIKKKQKRKNSSSVKRKVGRKKKNNLRSVLDIFGPK